MEHHIASSTRDGRLGRAQGRNDGKEKNPRRRVVAVVVGGTGHHHYLDLGGGHAVGHLLDKEVRPLRRDLRVLLLLCALVLV